MDDLSPFETAKSESWIKPKHGLVERIEAVLAVSADPRLKQYGKSAFQSLMLRFYNQTTQRCDPSHEALAASMGRHADTARRGVTALVKAGYLHAPRNRGGRRRDGRGYTNPYRFDWERITRQAEKHKVEETRRMEANRKVPLPEPDRTP